MTKISIKRLPIFLLFLYASFAPGYIYADGKAITLLRVERDYRVVPGKYIKTGQSIRFRALIKGEEVPPDTFDWQATAGDIYGDGEEAVYIAPNKAGPIEITVAIRKKGGIISRQSFSYRVYRQIGFIKADDMIDHPTEPLFSQWEIFLDYMHQRQIKICAGLVGYTLEIGTQEYLDRLKALHDSGYVEFFNHGYDHITNALNENGERYSEFQNTPFEEQKEHLLKAINLAKEKLNIILHTFGAPGNAIDDNTLRAVNEVVPLKVWLLGNPASEKTVLKNRCNIEASAGFPSFETFIREYNPDSEYLIFQCHPKEWGTEQFDIFTQILDYLEQQGVVFLTPYEYYRSTGTFYRLTVESVQETEVPITVEPDDIEDQGTSPTNFTRTYEKGTTVTLTAPGEYQGKDFSHWTIDGEENTTETVRIDMSGEHTVVVSYKIPEQAEILLDRSEIFLGGDGAGHRTEPQKIRIHNGGPGSFRWSAAADSSWLQIDPPSGTAAGEAEISAAPAGLNPGIHHGTITITVPNATNSPQTIHVTLAVYTTGLTAAPFGDFSTPLEGAEVYGSIPVTGWVLDDIGTTGVQIFADGTYIGDAVFIEGARPDVEEAYPHFPGNFQAGWGYMLLTHFLPNGGNGVYTLTATAADVEGNQVSLGSKTIIVDNEHAVAPFGAIDTPIQGGDASGTEYTNWGWVLTPLPNQVAPDGSTISVYVDGMEVGHPVYNNYRPDVAELFPGYANSEGAGGYFNLDTTLYENGVHTIFWIATDNAGNTGGIGSRFFNIGNGKTPGNQLSVTTQHRSGETNSLAGIPICYTDLEPVGVKSGYGSDSQLQFLAPDGSGALYIETRELQPLEIHLAGTDGLNVMENTSLPDTPRYRYSGYLMVRGQFRRLPIGSTLDRERGIFYWHPGPGFLGEYRLVFLCGTQTGHWRSKEVRIFIREGDKQPKPPKS